MALCGSSINIYLFIYIYRYFANILFQTITIKRYVYESNYLLSVPAASSPLTFLMPLTEWPNAQRTACFQGEHTHRAAMHTTCMWFKITTNHPTPYSPPDKTQTTFNLTGLRIRFTKFLRLVKANWLRRKGCTHT